MPRPPSSAITTTSPESAKKSSSGRHEVLEDREERAGQPGERPREHQRHAPVARDVDADRARPLLALAHRHERAPERRVDDAPRQGVARARRRRARASTCAACRRGRGRARPIPTRGRPDARQPVAAPGERHPLDGDLVEELGEGEGEHRHVHAARVHGEVADDDGQERGRRDADQRAPPTARTTRGGAPAPRRRRPCRRTRRGRTRPGRRSRAPGRARRRRGRR